MECSAPGKIILFGEHAVVHGKRAVAASIGLRLIGRYEPIESPTAICCISFEDFGNFCFQFEAKSFISAMPLGIEEFMKSNWCSKCTEDADFTSVSSMSDEMLKSAVKSFLILYWECMLKSNTSRVEGFSVSIRSEIPFGAGLGSSGAYAVVLATILSYHFGLPLEENELRELALRCERINHGEAASGLDNMISQKGGFACFQNGLLCPISHSFPGQVLLIDTGIVRSTKKMVEKVSQFRKMNPQRFQEIAKAIDEISESFILLDDDDDEQNCSFEKIKSLFGLNQRLLQEIGVSHERIQEIISIAAKSGLCGKLTGAGGGGFVIVPLFETSKEEEMQLVENLSKANYKCYSVEIGGKGSYFNFINKRQK